MAISSTFNLVLTFFLCLLPATISAAQGRIRVYQGSNYNNVATWPNVGCLDQYGQFTSTTTNCATFTLFDPNSAATGIHGYLSTSQGNCTWWYSTRPKNVDSAYGGLDSAFECGPGLAQMENNDFIYSLTQNFICTGDVNCFFDAKSIPAAGQTSLTWVYRWGSQQQGITPGHVQVGFKWVAI